MRGNGLARTLMQRLFDAARLRGYREIEGIVLRENPRMLKFCESLGFAIQPNPDDPGSGLHCELWLTRGVSTRPRSTAPPLSAAATRMEWR